ncbi:Calmodulin binding protein-like protein [Artemisia annua]|uniref:Calmodulin binding protein-like protein n=1 Tax=Artemisia annua TaxID=35608 RepID=A0A2U1KZ47_ARTAN|nr:Calmodulin binding protein-like protein [Artemisia annua]
MLIVASWIPDQRKTAKVSFRDKREIWCGFVDRHEMFINGISTPVATGIDIKGKDNKPFVLALLDGISGEVVTTGAAASMEVEIVVLVGDSDNDEAENWPSNEFNNKIVREWNGRKVLQGKTIVTIKEGIIVLDKYSFTHNSEWKGNRNCRLGAKAVNSVFSNSVKTTITKSFPVKDKRKLMYNKNPVPSLSDHVYRLYEISRRGERYKRLIKANIKTVMDLLTLNAINPERLKKADAQELIVSSSEHWEEVVSFNNEASLINHLQSRTTLNSLRNSLNVLIPDTIDTYDHTCLASPQVSTPIVQTGVAGQSQSPKRPAFEQATSYSPKKQRDDHPRMGPSTSNVGNLTSGVIVSETFNECQDQNSLLTPAVNDDIDWLNLIDLSHYDINPTQRWKMVWRVVGWISIFSKVRKRRMTSDDDTVYFIEASFEHM